VSSFQNTFIDLIRLEPDSEGNSVGPPAPEPFGRTYGGQFMAQGLAAAYHTVSHDRQVHSLHAYFLRGGNVANPTTYHVDTVRDGRSFSIRSVSGHQDGQELFRMMMSFQVPETGLEYQRDGEYQTDTYSADNFGANRQTSSSYNEFTLSHPDLNSDDDWSGDRRPIEIVYLNSPEQPDQAGHEPLESIVEPQLMWQRISGEIPDDPRIHDIGLVYLSDSTLVDHVTLPHGYRWQDNRLTGTTLDHSMWFHRRARADQWVLYDQQVETTGGGRGLVSGRIYDQAGVLAATCSQEGLMRWDETR